MKNLFMHKFQFDLNEPHHEKKKQHFAYAKNKCADSSVVTAKLIGSFLFTTQIVQFL